MYFNEQHYKYSLCACKILMSTLICIKNALSFPNGQEMTHQGLDMWLISARMFPVMSCQEYTAECELFIMKQQREAS